MSIDLYLFKKINGLAKKSIFLDFLGVFCAQYLGYLMIVWVFALGFLNNNWAMILVPLSTGAVAILAINEAVYFFYKRKRPIEVMQENALIAKPISPSFPSSHTSFFFAFSLALILYNLPLALTFCVLSLLIAVSRVFCGVHWPSDILGGIASALVSFIFLLLVFSIKISTSF